MRLWGIVLLVLMLFVPGAMASGGSSSSDELVCAYGLDAVGDETGKARVRIIGTRMRIRVEQAHAETVYTVWIDHRSRETSELSGDYPLAQGALPRGVAPAFATTTPVYSGMRRDRNVFKTDAEGEALFRVRLDYRLLDAGASPVVNGNLVMQGLNRVGGEWLRAYEWNPMKEVTQQVVNERGVPVLPRSTAQGITIVAHPYPGLTHGMTPGVGGVDHVPAWQGDFPVTCR